MLRYTLAATTLLLGCALSGGFAQDEKDDMVENPYYKGWAKHKVGAFAVLEEKTTHADGAHEERVVRYVLLRSGPERVAVRTVVIEKELLSRIESAPTTIFYPAKVKKADFEAALEEHNAKKGKETIKVLGKEMECVTFDLTRKNKNEEVKSKIWANVAVPGGIVKRVRTTSQDGKVVAKTTVTLVRYQLGGEGFRKEKGKKDKPKE
jgi:hypothetical protein